MAQWLWHPPLLDVWQVLGFSRMRVGVLAVWSSFRSSKPLPVPAGPERLDLGDVLYAPNAFMDACGRVLMLAWLQELRGDARGGFDYAGCLSLPRVLTLQGGSHPFAWVQPWDQPGCAMPQAVSGRASMSAVRPADAEGGSCGSQPCSLLQPESKHPRACRCSCAPKWHRVLARCDAQVR